MPTRRVNYFMIALAAQAVTVVLVFSIVLMVPGIEQRIGPGVCQRMREMMAMEGGFLLSVLYSTVGSRQNPTQGHGSGL